MSNKSLNRVNVIENIDYLLSFVPEDFHHKLEAPVSGDALDDFKRGIIKKGLGIRKIGLKIPLINDNVPFDSLRAMKTLAVISPNNEDINIRSFSESYIEPYSTREEKLENERRLPYFRNRSLSSIQPMTLTAISNEFIINATDILRKGNQINFDVLVSNSDADAGDAEVKYDIAVELTYLDKDDNIIASGFILARDSNAFLDDSTRYEVRFEDEQREVFNIRFAIRKFDTGYRDVLLETKRVGAEETQEKLSEKKVGKYQFWKYKRFHAPNEAPFVKMNYSEVNPNKKTLLLFHGLLNVCFKFKNNGLTNKGSFQFLLPSAKKATNNWFEQLLQHLDGLEGVENFEQIIAIDRPTVFSDPLANLEKLSDIFKYKGGRKSWGPRTKKIVFQKPVSIISKSQGGFLARLIAISDKEEWQTVDRVALVSSGYIKPEKINSYVYSSLALMPLLPLAIPFALLTFEVLKETPGIKAHLLDSPTFETIYNGVTDAYFFNITNNKNAGNRNKPATDGFVSLEAQQDHNPALEENCFPNHLGSKAHKESLTDEEARKQLIEFISSPLQPLLQDPIAGRG